MTTEREQRTTARMQFRIEPERIGWIHAALQNQPEVALYEGSFPEPFETLSYRIAQQGDQAMIMAILGKNDEFTSKYGNSVGSPKDLEPLLRRYPNHQYLQDGSVLVAVKNNEVAGVIATNPDGKSIVVQKGGNAGAFTISQSSPVNDLAIGIDQFNLLLQRYVSAIWNASVETDKKQIGIVLDLPPQLPEGTTQSYLSAFEVLSNEFTERPRPITLDQIGGYQKMKDLIRSLFMDMSEPEIARKFGTQPFGNRFILVTGDEGSGKSLFPKALEGLIRTRYESRAAHIRVHFPDLFTRYGLHSSTVFDTVVEHVKGNEGKRIPTVLHLDHLESLIPPNQRPDHVKNISEVEFSYALQTINPILVTLASLGRELGAQSRYIVVYGESRAKREELPEAVTRAFRRSFHLQPTPQDLAEVLKVQINTTRSFAERTGVDPFIAGIENEFQKIAAKADGLVGRDIQQAVLNVATRHKAEYDGKNPAPIDYKELEAEIDAIRISRGTGASRPRYPFGFPVPNRDVKR